MKKRVLSAILVLSMAAAALAGCSGGGGNTPTTTAEGTNASGETEVPVELTILTYDGVKTPDGRYSIEVQAEAYMAENPNVKINVDMQSENNSVDFLKKLDLMHLSGSTADVIKISAYRDMSDRALQDFFMPLDDMMTSEGIQFDELYDYTSKVGDSYYAIPYNPGIYHVLINKDMLDAANLPVPEMDWTWEEYAEYAKAMTSGEGANKIYGSYMHTWSEYRREGLFNSKMDNPFVKEDGSSNLDDPNLRNWLQFMYDMENVDQSQVSYSDAIATKMAYRDVFFQGKAAMTLTGSWIYDDINNTESFPHDFATVFAPFPVWADGPAGRTQSSASYYTIGNDSENAEEAYKFIRWMSLEGAAVVNDMPSVKGTDYSSVIEAKIGDNEALYDKESLLRIWNNPDLEANAIYSYPDVFVAIDDVFNSETGKFMVGGQDLDTTMQNLKEQGEAFIK